MCAGMGRGGGRCEGEWKRRESEGRERNGDGKILGGREMVGAV